MIRYKQLVTFKMIDKDTKETIGKIHDVIYSDNYKKIDYFIVKNNNLIKNKFLVEYKSICFLNKNQFLCLKDMEFEKKLEKDIESEKLGFKFLERQIRTEDDGCIGYVKDVVINKEDGTIDGLIITEGLLEDLLKGRNYIPLQDNMRINEEYIYISNNILV